MADLIISQPMTFTVDVKNGLVERPQRESLMRGDKMANRIIAELVYGSEPFDITGVTVKGKFCRPPSGDEIDLAGEAKGNVAEVQLNDQCYTSGGHYEARVILVLGGVERTVLFISGDVLKSGSGNAAGDEETGGSGGSTGSGLPAGGTNGQVLVKVSSAQGDAIWKNLTAADVGARPDNWMPTAADVGALPSDGTAANANALNGKDAVYYLGARDLLDNSNFEIAQAGYGGKHGTTRYAADRWLSSGGDVVKNDNGISITGGNWGAQLQQKVPASALRGKTITAAFKVKSTNGKAWIALTTTDASGANVDVASNVVDCSESTIVLLTITVSQSAEYVWVKLDNNAQETVTFNVEWAALYEGEYTADNLPPYVAPDPVLELAKCQRYYYKTPNDAGLYGYTGSSGTVAYAYLPVSEEMRISNPSYTLSGQILMCFNGSNKVSTTINSVVTRHKQMELRVAVDAGPSNSLFVGYIGGGNLELYADL